jgi:hypothetical protein
MTDEAMTAELHCAQCDKETLHTIVYAGRLLVSSTCQICGMQVKHESNDLRFHYVKDLEHRLITKPRRLWRRFWRTPVTLTITLPKKVMQQPAKLWNEIKTLFR